MSPERKRGSESSAARQLWEITKPQDARDAAHYYEVLNATIAVQKPLRFETSFERPKKSGRGTRKITPAAEPLRTTQYYLANWIRDNLPQGQDYCYTGRRVNAALDVHRDSNYALVVDLKDAFDQVTDKKIKNWFSYYDERLRGEPVELITDLLTFQGKAPQGCRSTAFAYNVTVAEMDHHLDVVAGALGVDNWTRYSDNICFSSKEEFDTQALEEQTRRITKGFGFDLSWSKPQEGSIEYLGAKIEGGNIYIPDEKAGEFLDRIYDWLESDDPVKHYRQALGIMVWARELSGPNVNQMLLEALAAYFRKIGKPDDVEKNMGRAYGKLL